MIAFKVVTPKGEYLKQEVKSIHVKTVVGETTILPNHMPIFASLVPCKLVLKNENDEEEIFAISGGFLQFNKKQLIEFMYMASNPRHFLLLNFSKLVASVLKMSIIVFSS